jgi:hypothetical protein
MMRRLAAVALCLAAPAAALATATPAGGPGGRPPMLDCRDRITGAMTIVNGVTRPFRFRFRPRHDTRIGPVAFTGAADYAGSWDELVREDQWLKTPVLVRRGARVRLEVPAEQRSWMRPHIASAGEAEGVVDLRGCRRPATRRECGPGPRETCRSAWTPFSGGFEIDFANAPQQGRCAELIVRSGGKARRERLYRPPAGLCG